MEQTARSISLFVNSDKLELMCFNQDGAIYSLKGKPLKKVEQFTYLGSNIASRESMEL